MKTLPLGPLALVLALLAASFVPPAAAQNQICGDKDWHGEQNEFGRICMKFQETMVGEPVYIEARIVLNHLYEDRDAAYYLFEFPTTGTPFKISDVKLQSGGADIPLYKREGDKLFVDVAEMPPAGEEMVFSATIASCDRGLYQIGALLQPFNYRWQKIVMSNGEQADLYGFTQVGVNEASCRGGIPGLPKMDAPSGGLVGAVSALALVAAFAQRKGAAAERRGRLVLRRRR